MQNKDLAIEVIPSEDKQDKKAHKLHALVPKPPLCALLVGSPGTGKSSLIWTMCSKWYKGYYDLIIIYNGVMDANAAFLKLQDGKTKVIIQNTWRPAVFQAFLEALESENMKLEADGVRRRNVLVVFDDMITNQIMKPANVTILDRAIQNRRHYSLSIVISTQSYKQANRSVRALNLSCLIVTGVNMDELAKIAEEHQSPLYSSKDVIKLYQKAMEVPRSFFMINYKQPTDRRYWRNLDTLLTL